MCIAKVWQVGVKFMCFIWGRWAHRLACGRRLCWGKAPCWWIRALKVRSCRWRGKKRTLMSSQDDYGKFDLWVRYIFDVQVDLWTTFGKWHLLFQEEKWFDETLYWSVGLTLSLYSALMMEQLRMEGSASCGMLMTFVTFWLVDAGMGSPTSFMRSLVRTFRLPFAKKLCFLYTVYLGLISRDELFTMWATTFNPSPAWKRPTMFKTSLKEPIRVETTRKALTLKEPSFLKIYIHGYFSWV